MIQRLERWVESVLYGSRKGMVPTLYRTAVSPMAFLFGSAVRGRHILYDRHVLPALRVDIPVISVGNVVAGGTGKTEVVSLLIKELEAHFKVAVVSRGYRGSLGGHVSHVVNPTKDQAVECGDEPWLLAHRHPETLVIVDKERVRGARAAVQLGADIILLDDGMQHRRLERDIEIVVVDGERSLEGERFLPSGLLRDDPRRLRVADLVIVTGRVSPVARKKLAELTDAPLVSMQMEPVGVYDLKGELQAVEKGSRVALYCGIANPSRFVRTVEQMGYEVCLSHFEPDHRMMSPGGLEHFMHQAECAGASCVLCTEKDKVKLRQSMESAFPIFWVRGALNIQDNRTAFRAMLQRIGT